MTVERYIRSWLVLCCFHCLGIGQSLFITEYLAFTAFVRLNLSPVGFTVSARLEPVAQAGCAGRTLLQPLTQGDTAKWDLPALKLMAVAPLPCSDSQARVDVLNRLRRAEGQIAAFSAWWRQRIA